MVNKLNWTSLFEKTKRIVWALFFMTLPVTSFPFFPSDLGGKTLVQPLVIYPLMILLVLVTIPRLFSRPVPKTFLPIFAFVVVAIISSFAAFAPGIEPLLGVTVESRFIRNLATLGVGMAIYITTALLPDDWNDMKFSLRWLYAGFVIALLWGTFQAIYIVHYSPSYFNLLDELQSLVSTRKLFPTRISGLTYEPKWFAEQIVFLLSPWLLGAILSRRSIFKWHYKWISIESILLAWAVFVLIFTYSRSGFLIFTVLAVLSYLIYRSYTQRHLSNKKPAIKSKGRRILEASSLFFGLILVLVLVGSQNAYFSRLWRYWTDAKSRNRTYLEYISVEQRFVYWETAYRTFQAHPILGVGLGNFAFYFDDMLPDRQWDSQKEIIRQLTPTEGRSRLITPKNLFGRILSETGLFGFAAFTAFIIAIIGGILYLWFSPHPEQKYWGMSGFISIVAFAFVIFSFDSFALPNMWIVFGLITAAAHMHDPD